MLGDTCNDNTFGPQAKGCRRAFDFTLLFEQTVLSIGPSILFILIGLPAIFLLISKPLAVRPGRLLWCKQFVLLTLFSVQAALVAACADSPQYASPYSITAAALGVPVYVTASILSSLEHLKNQRPSSLLLVYFLSTAVLDAARVRTIWLLLPSTALAALSSVSLALKLIATFLETWEKRHLLNGESIEHCPEDPSSFLNRAVFFWLYKLLWTGARRHLHPEDLYSLPDALKPARWEHAFSRHLDPRLGARLGVARTLLKVLGWQILETAFPRLILLALSLCTPIILHELLSYLEEPTDSRSQSVGYGLIGAFALVYLGIALSTGFYWRLQFRTLILLRNCLVTAISRKSIRLKASSIDDPKAVLTLMSTDLDRAMYGLEELHEVWANTIQAGLAALLLYQYTGLTLAAVAPIILAAVCALGSILNSKSAIGRQQAWMKAVQYRVGLMSKFVPQVKGLRLRGLEAHFFRQIEKARFTELGKAKAFRRLLLRTNALGFAPELLSPVLTFLVLTVSAGSGTRPFNASQAFTILSLLNILAQPLSLSLQIIPSFVASFGCLERIGKFLNAEEYEDPRIFHAGSSIREAPSLPDDQSSKGWNSENGSEKIAFQGAIDTIPLTDSGCCFSIRRGSFGYTPGTPVLDDVNVDIFSGLNFVVGPVASGKTTFCKALLGECILSGDVMLHGTPTDISYCDQDVFLQNLSIRESIVSFKSFDQSWYSKVIEACAFKADISSMPHGDRTKVGSNGISLSGGQKQKLALARAVYARSRILILDEPVSSMDARSARHVLQRVVGSDGLVQRNGGTIIFATHSTGWLEMSGHAIVLGPSRSIEHQGPCEEIRRVISYITGDDSVAGGNGDKDEPDSHVIPAKVTDVDGQDKNEASANSIASFDDTPPRSSDTSLYRYYFGAAGVGSMVFMLCAGLMVATLYTVPSYWLEVWSTNQSPLTEISTWGIYATLLGLALASLAGYACFTLLYLVTRTGLELHRRALKALIAASWTFLSATDSGKITNLFSQDIQLIDGKLPLTLMNLILTILFSFGQAVLVIVSSPWAGLAFPVMLAILYVIQKFYIRTSSRLRLLELEAKSPLYSSFDDTARGICTLRAFGVLEKTHLALQELLQLSQKPLYLLYMVQRWLNFVIDLVVACVAVVVSAISVTLQANSGSTGLALTQVMSMSLMMRAFMLAWTNFETSIGAVNRLKTFAEGTPTENDTNAAYEPPLQWPINGSIRIKNLTVYYDITIGKPALRNISVDIKAGESVGICGRSGSGKTSLVLSLLRILDFHNGTIEIDGVDLRRVPRELVRQRINVVPQDPTLLPGSVRSNLDPSGTIPEPTLEIALRKVNLWQLLEARGGLSADISADTFSCGQRQLFCLATALLGQEKIVVLDEATSSLDPETENTMRRIITEEFAGRTVLSIFHRQHGIGGFDKMLRFEDGHVREERQQIPQS